MSIKEQFMKKITITVWQRQCILISTFFATLCLLTAWPRFHSDAMSLDWYVYLVLASVFLIPIFKSK